MHDRHSGLGFEIQPVYIEASDEIDARDLEEDSVEAKHSNAAIHVATLNMHMLFDSSLRCLICCAGVMFCVCKKLLRSVGTILSF